MIGSRSVFSYKNGRRAFTIAPLTDWMLASLFFNAIRIALKNKDASIQSVNGAIVNALRPFLYENTEREPIIIPMILTPDEDTL